MLWEKQRQTIVNNEWATSCAFSIPASATWQIRRSIDSIRMTSGIGLNALNDRMYPRFNNEVYRAGFANTQRAYEEAFTDVFGMLAELKTCWPDGGPFLFGDRFTGS